MRKRLFDFLFIIYIFLSVINVKALTVSSVKNDIGAQDDGGMVWYTKDGKEHHGAIGKITLSDGKVALCIDPGIATPNEGATCTRTLLKGENAAKALAIFNSTSDETIQGFALRMSEIGGSMKQSGSSDAYQAAINNKTEQGNVYGVELTGKVAQAKKLAEAAKTTSKSATGKNGGKPSAEVVGEKTIKYYNMPKDTKVVIDCDFCQGSKTLDVSGTGSFTLQIDDSFYKECENEETFIVEFKTKEKVTLPGSKIPGYDDSDSGENDSGDGDNDNDSDSSGNNACTEAYMYTCGSNGSSQIQRFVGCNTNAKNNPTQNSNPTNNNKKEPYSNTETEPPSEESGDEDEYEDYYDVVGPLSNKVECKETDEDCPPEIMALCPDEPDYLHIPDNYGNGEPDPYCENGVNPIEVITEADDIEKSSRKYDLIKCCILGNSKNKVNIQRDDICGTGGVYCTENYEFNTAATKPPLAVAPNDAKNITAGSYFNLNISDDSGNNILLKDRTKIYCYTQNVPDKLVEEIVTKANNLASDSYKTTVDCTQKTRERYDYTCYYSKYNSETGTTDRWNDTCQVYEKTNCCPKDNLSSSTSTEHDELINEWVQTVHHYKYRANSNGLGLTWSWVEDLSKQNRTTTTSGCVAPTGPYISVNNSNLKSSIDPLIEKYNRLCNDSPTLANKMEETFSSSCEKEISFDYYDGHQLKLKQDYLKFKTVSSTTSKSTNQENYHCTFNSNRWNCGSSPEVSFDFGKDSDGRNYGSSGSTKIINSNLLSAHIQKDNSYDVHGIDICNDYSNNIRTYGDDCKPADYSDTSKGITHDVGWPVSYDTQYGEYEYSFKTKIVSCIPNKYTTEYMQHVCYYNVNGCNGCEFSCDIGDDCEMHDCDRDCQKYCLGVGCVYDGGVGLALNYQPISLVNFDSAFAMITENYSGVKKLGLFRNNNSQIKATQLGTGGGLSTSRNWSDSKGLATKDAIKKSGEEIYKVEPQYRFVLKPSDIKEIQDYNNKVPGGYLNNLDDYKMKCSIQDSSIEYVVCNSLFIREFMDKKNIKHDVTGEFVSAKQAKGVDASSIKRKSGTGPAWK